MGKEKEKEMESKQMLRFNLVNGDSYTLLGDEAVDANDAWETSLDYGFMFKFEDKIVILYEQHIVSIEQRGME